MGSVVWILVDHSSRATAFSSISENLSEHDVHCEILTITEVLGNAAKGAISGSAERLIRGLRVAFKGRSDEDFVGAIEKGKPDMIVVTHQRYVRALSLLKSVTGSDATQVGVCTDYNFSESWSKSSVQAFVVPHADFESQAARGGLPGSRIVVAGPPIQASFERELDQAKIRSDFNFKEDEKVVLVRSNGFDLSTLDKLLFQSTLVDSKCRYLFHHDGDGTSASTLREAASKYGVSALMFGKVNDLERFVCAADLVVCAAQEPYISDIIALDKPVVFVGPDTERGQQVDFLSAFGAAGHIQEVLRFGGAFESYLEKDWLESAGKAAAALSNQKANEGVAEALLSILNGSKSWVEDQPPKKDSPHSNGDSPFEEIGGDENNNDGDSYVGISKAEAKEQLAALILTERALERKLAELEKQQERWRKRLQMARDMEEEDLATDAESILREYIEEGSRLQSELKSILGQKNKLKVHAGAGASRTLSPNSTSHEKVEEMERKFRKMELDSDLDNLKDRIKRELGE